MTTTVAGTPRYAWYGRVSTEDEQDPTLSFPLDILPRAEARGFLRWMRHHAAIVSEVLAGARGGLLRAARFRGLAPCSGVGARTSPRARMFSAALLSAWLA